MDRKRVIVPEARELHSISGDTILSLVVSLIQIPGLFQLYQPAPDCIKICISGLNWAGVCVCVCEAKFNFGPQATQGNYYKVIRVIVKKRILHTKYSFLVIHIQYENKCRFKRHYDLMTFEHY